MGSLSIGYTTRALFGITKQQSKEGTVGAKADLRSISCCVSSLEQVHVFHMDVECGVSLSFFLVPDKPSSDNYHVAGMFDAASLACKSESVHAVSVSASSLLTGRMKSLVVWLQVKSCEQLGDWPTCWILFMHDRNLKVSGKRQPGEEKGQESCLARTKDICYCQGRSARSEGQRKAGGHRNDVPIILPGGCAKGNNKAGRLETVLHCIAGGQHLEEGM